MQKNSVSLARITGKTGANNIVNGMCTTFGQRNNMINRVEIFDIFVAIRTTIVKMFKYALPLFLGKLYGSSSLPSSMVRVGQLDVVAIPILTLGAKSIGVFQRRIGNATFFAGAIVFGSWLQCAPAKNNTFVASMTHAPDKSSIARCGAAANLAWAELGSDGRRLESAFSALGFFVAVVAQFFLVIFLNLAALWARTRKPDFRHLDFSLKFMVNRIQKCLYLYHYYQDKSNLLWR